MTDNENTSELGRLSDIHANVNSTGPSAPLIDTNASDLIKDNAEMVTFEVTQRCTESSRDKHRQLDTGHDTSIGDNVELVSIEKTQRCTESRDALEYREPETEHDTSTGNEDKDTTYSDVPKHPTDTGWAWVILAGCFFEIFLHGGTLKSYGVLFVQYQERFQSTASETALMNTIQNLMISFTGLFVMTIGLQKFTSRTVIVVGGALQATSFFVTAFARSLGVYYVIMGVVGGIGTSMIHPPMFAILGTYFDRHRGLANSIFVSGASIGSVVMAPSVTKMFEVYGYTGTMMIISALFGNIIVSGLLMRPPETYTRSRKRSRRNKPVESNILATTEDNLLLNGDDNRTEDQTLYTPPVNELQMKYNGIANINHNNRFLYDNENIDPSKCRNYSSGQRQLQRMNSYEGGCPTASMQTESPLLHRVRALSVGNKRTTEGATCLKTATANAYSNNVNRKLDDMCRSQLSVFATSEAIVAISAHTNNVQKAVSNKENNTENVHAVDSHQCRVPTSIVTLLVTIFDLSLLKNPVFITFLAVASSLISGMAISPLYIPPYAKDIGISNDRVAMLISLQSIIELVSRLTCAVVVDRKLFRSTTVLGSAAIAVGTACHVIRFIRTFPAFVALFIVIGLCGGLYISTFAVILAEFIGLPQYKSSLGFTTLCHGVSIATFFPISGLLRDTTGSYIASYHLFGSLSYVGAVLVLLLPKVHKWTENGRRHTHSNDVLNDP